MRADFLAYNLSCQRIGKSPLETVPDFNAGFPVVACHQEQRAVVFSLLSDLVRFRHPQGVLFKVFSVER
jgi:hypothetical protein